MIQRAAVLGRSAEAGAWHAGAERLPRVCCVGGSVGSLSSPDAAPLQSDASAPQGGREQKPIHPIGLAPRGTPPALGRRQLGKLRPGAGQFWTKVVMAGKVGTWLNLVPSFAPESSHAVPEGAITRPCGQGPIPRPLSSDTVPAGSPRVCALPSLRARPRPLRAARLGPSPGLGSAQAQTETCSGRASRTLRSGEPRGGRRPLPEPGGRAASPPAPSAGSRPWVPSPATRKLRGRQRRPCPLSRGGCSRPPPPHTADSAPGPCGRCRWDGEGSEPLSSQAFTAWLGGRLEAEAGAAMRSPCLTPQVGPPRGLWGGRPGSLEISRSSIGTEKALNLRSDLPLSPRGSGDTGDGRTPKADCCPQLSGFDSRLHMDQTQLAVRGQEHLDAAHTGRFQGAVQDGKGEMYLKRQMKDKQHHRQSCFYCHKNSYIS
nr:transcription initiation factor TFIID subunit 4-like [Symphalangus syndactylus]